MRIIDFRFAVVVVWRNAVSPVADELVPFSIATVKTFWPTGVFGFWTKGVGNLDPKFGAGVQLAGRDVVSVKCDWKNGM